MTWENIEDVLFDGSPEEILALRCPECGEEIDFQYSAETRSLEIRCKGCGMISRAHGVAYEPNCARLQGRKEAG